jgi:hypothetical protein
VFRRDRIDATATVESVRTGDTQTAKLVFDGPIAPTVPGLKRDPGNETAVDELALILFDTTNDRHTVAETIATYTL